MSQIGPITTVKTPKDLIGPTFVGKRVNFLGNIGFVKEHSDQLCLIKFDDYITTSITMQRVIAATQHLKEDA